VAKPCLRTVKSEVQKTDRASSPRDEAAAHAQARAELVEAAPIAVADRKISW
jgi:hypothetical protein